MKDTFTTGRLTLHELTLDDAQFIYELLNTEDWIKFIGDRNIRSIADAGSYIQKIITNPNGRVWVMKVKGSNSSIGIISLVKRDYLEYHDIGFALLPPYYKKGYAYEAAKLVLEELKNNPAHPTVLAITIRENNHSIGLLEKLGLQHEREMDIEGEQILIYSTIKDK